MTIDTEKVDSILKTAASRFRGPGGAVAVIKDGGLVATHTWGYADMDRRIAMTPQTMFPICSITKQFVAALLVELEAHPPLSVRTNEQDGRGTFNEQMEAALQELLPSSFVDHHGMTVDNLVDMASGLRDYWALCTLQGSRPETIYSIQDHNADMIRRLQTLHFEPGTEYSYANTNFNIVERLIETVTGDNLQNLLRHYIFDPAGMKTAHICARTDRFPSPIIGYEGSESFGFIPAANYIEWSADAGMVASLTDMIAYEKYFDRRYSDELSTYRLAVNPRKYKNSDSATANYRHGLFHSTLEGVAKVGHAGALRGFKLNRHYVERERLSVVVLFNHSGSAGEAVDYIFKQILEIPEPKIPQPTIVPDEKWFGSFIDGETKLSVRVKKGEEGKVSIMYVRGAETLTLSDPLNAKSDDVQARIEGDVLHVNRIMENRVLKCQRLTVSGPLLEPMARLKLSDESEDEISRPKFLNTELNSTFSFTGDFSPGGMLYGLFDGMFGSGPPLLMTNLGRTSHASNEDVWVLADNRAMDDQPPGDWTVVFLKGADGEIEKVVVGCWLARKLDYVRV